MGEVERRQLVADIYREKREWLAKSTKRLYDAGMSADDIASTLDIAKMTVRYVLHYDFDINWKEMK